MFICGKKQLHPHALLEILQRYANFLFWVLWTCLIAHTQNDSINLYKTLMFICMQKTNFIIHFILEILHFKESCNLIGCSNLRTRILPDMRLTQIRAKNEFSWKKELCQFLDIPIIYHCAKNQKKLLSNFWGKHQTDGQTDRQTTVI